MIIRILSFFFAYLLSFNVKQGLKWFRKTSQKSILKSKQDDKDTLPMKKDWTNLSHLIKIVELRHGEFPTNRVVTMKIPSSNFVNVFAAAMLLMAVLNITSCNFSTANSFSWYSLFIVASACTVHQLNAETNFLSTVQDLQTVLFHLLPYRLISRLWGRMCCIYVIPSLRPFLFKFYITIYGVKFEEALVDDLTQYQTMSEFFCRNVKPELRPIHVSAQIVSPADGTVIYNNVLYDGTIRNVKGINYSIRKFLGPLQNGGDDFSNQVYVQNLVLNPQENDLYCSVIYLAAGDYHRFHSPTCWRLLLRRHFAGDLLSVNPRFLSWVSNLFILNERVLLSGLWRHGYFSMTAVGATNVGSIVVHKDQTLQTNLPYALKGLYLDRKFDEVDVSYAKGDEVGMFKLGSTVVLIYEAPKQASLQHKEGEKIKYGEQLMTII